jgi:hypothetical protein
MWQVKLRRFSPRDGVSRPCSRTARTATVALPLVLMIWLSVNRAWAQQGDLGFSPVSGHAQVIAQGVVELPRGQAVWRTVRARAPKPPQATFESRSLGFVFASSGPLLLIDGKTGEQSRLGIGEAALVREGTLQQRASLADDAVTYLAVELVSSSAAPPVGGTVLETGEPFAAPSGQHDLDLLADTLAIGENLSIPDSGGENLLLVTTGAAAVTSPNGDSEVLLAGEKTTFAGERSVSAARDSYTPVSFLAAIIGPEVPTPTLSSQAAGSPVPADTAAGKSDGGEGSITILVYACPAGMTAQKIDITACAVINDGFEITISAPELEQPLTLVDAETSSGGLTWDQLPPGDYEIAETVLPTGATSYVLAARGANGGRISIDAAQPDQSVRIYNFSP